MINKETITRQSKKGTTTQHQAHPCGSRKIILEQVLIINQDTFKSIISPLIVFYLNLKGNCGGWLLKLIRQCDLPKEAYYHV
jgi:hypothetical protein